MCEVNPAVTLMLEDTNHFFFTCYKYKEARDVFLIRFSNIVNLNIVNTRALLGSDSEISDIKNKHLFSLVYRYIKDTQRFSWCLYTIANSIYHCHMICWPYILCIHNFVLYYIHVLLLGESGLSFWTCA